MEVKLSACRWVGMSLCPKRAASYTFITLLFITSFLKNWLLFLKAKNRALFRVSVRKFLFSKNVQYFYNTFPIPKMACQKEWLFIYITWTLWRYLASICIGEVCVTVYKSGKRDKERIKLISNCQLKFKYGLMMSKQDGTICPITEQSPGISDHNEGFIYRERNRKFKI